MHVGMAIAIKWPLGMSKGMDLDEIALDVPKVEIQQLRSCVTAPAPLMKGGAT